VWNRLKAWWRGASHSAEEAAVHVGQQARDVGQSAADAWIKQRDAILDTVEEQASSIAGATKEFAKTVRDQAATILEDGHRRASQAVGESADIAKSVATNIGNLLSGAAHQTGHAATKAKDETIHAAIVSKGWLDSLTTRIHQSFEHLAEEAKHIAHDTYEYTAQKAHDVKEGVKSAAGETVEGVKEAGEYMGHKAEAVLDKAKHGAEAAYGYTAEKAEEAKKGVKDAGDYVGHTAEAVLDKAKHGAEAAYGYTAEKAEEAKKGVESIAHQAKEGVKRVLAPSDSDESTLRPENAYEEFYQGAKQYVDNKLTKSRDEIGDTLIDQKHRRFMSRHI